MSPFNPQSQPAGSAPWKAAAAPAPSTDTARIASLVSHTLAPIEISESEFSFIRDLIHSKFGINLGAEKKALVVGRLQKYIKSLGFKDFAGYIDSLGRNPSPSALSELVDRITTNHTFFYRESDHFDFLRSTVLPEISGRIERSGGERDLRVWCAGCSSGEEAYCLAIVMMEFFGPSYSLWQAGLLATDISDKALTAAQEGVYPAERLDKAPQEFVSRYFERVDAGHWRVADRVKREVTFRRFNLMNERFPFKRPFHIIFCRNVMIYFDANVRAELIRKFHQWTAPVGYLFIGHAESLGRDCPHYSYVRPAVYKREN